MRVNSIIVKIVPILLVLCIQIRGYSQVPQGFSYQAVVRDGTGKPIANQTVGLRVSLLNASQVPYYTETHSPKSNELGIITIVIGTGTKAVGSNSFNSIPWKNGDIAMKIEIDPTGKSNYTAMGDPTKIQSVPYALFTETPKEVVSQPTSTDDEPIFVVRNKAGQIVFAVYQTGVRVYVEDTGTKGAKGGFAVGGLSNQSKDGSAEFLRITSDSARININETAVKGAKGGFAVGGLSNQSKGTSRNLMFVAPDSTRFYIDDSNTPKGAKGGFAVGGLSNQSKRNTAEYMRITSDSARIYTNETTAKGAKGGFAVGGLSNQSKSLVARNIMYVASDSTRIYIDDSNSSKGAKGGFAVGGLSNQSKGKKSNFFNISTDATGIVNPSENRVLWYPIKNAFLAGRVFIASPDSVGENSFSAGFESKAKGNYSQALGYRTIAEGEYSTAIGKNAKAHRNNSYAFGEGANANTLNSYALGNNAKTTIGYGTMIDDANFAIGQGAQAGGLYSYSFGRISVAVGTNAFAFGEASMAVADDAYAFGLLSKASGIGSIALGSKSFSSGEYSLAIGSNPLAGNDSTAASGKRAFAIGVNSRAIGDYSAAIGAGEKIDGFSNIIANGKHSMVFGSFARSDNHIGTFVFGDWASDYTSADLLKATADNQFIARATGGYVWHTDKSLTESKTLYVNANSGDIGVGIASADHRVSVLGTNNNLLRLIGINQNGSGARMTFGDVNKIYIEEDQDNMLKINAYDRLAITGQYGLKVGIGEENPDYKLTINGTNVSNQVLKLLGEGSGTQYGAKIAFGNDDKTYMQQYAADKFKLKIYNQLFIDGETNFKINIGSLSVSDHTVNIKANSSNYALKLEGNVYDGSGAKLSFGTFADYAYIQEDQDDKILIYSNNGLTLNGTNQYKVGIKTDTPSTLLDVGGGIRTQISANGKNILVAGDAQINGNVYVDGVLKVGSIGTALGSIIKYIEYRDIASIPANSAKVETFTVTGTAPGAVVTISPYDALPNGLNISYTRASAANTVEVKFYNATASAIDPSGTTFYIVAIY